MAQLLLCFPHRKGYVSLEDYTSFLIDKESENIKTSDDIESGFQALAEGKAYITKEDMKQVGFHSCVSCSDTIVLVWVILVLALL